MIEEELAGIAESVQKLIKINDDSCGVIIYASNNYVSVDFGNVTLSKGKDGTWNKAVTTEFRINDD